jgi:hypothetical protein
VAFIGMLIYQFHDCWNSACTVPFSCGIPRSYSSSVLLIPLLFLLVVRLFRIISKRQAIGDQSAAEHAKTSGKAGAAATAAESPAPLADASAAPPDEPVTMEGA